MSKKSLVFLSAKRTPFGSFGGEFKDLSPVDLSLTSARGALEESGLEASDVMSAIYGHVLYSSPDSIYLPRHVGLKLGMPMERDALGINRLCGSGFQVIVEAYQQMLSDDHNVILVGGVENMSMAPYLLRTARFGSKMGHQPMIDSMSEALTDLHVNMPMAITAENLATKYKISREECDAFALQSQQRAQDAIQNGHLKKEITPVRLSVKGKDLLFEADTHPRKDTTSEQLSKLKPIFKKDGVVTAGNASGIVDGAASMVLAEESYARSRGLKPLGRLVSYGIVGCDPSIMGIGPVNAVRIALNKANLKLSDMDLIEVNEAFAPQVLAVLKELSLKPDAVNLSGGAISLGHPLAASGTRIVGHLLHELRRRGKRYGLGTACIGGGQGIAMLVEAMT